MLLMIVNVVQLRLDPSAFMVEERTDEGTHRLIVVSAAEGEDLRCSACESSACLHVDAAVEHDEESDGGVRD